MCAGKNWEDEGLGDPCDAIEMEVWEYVDRCRFYVRNPERYVDELDRLVDNFSLQKIWDTEEWLQKVNAGVYKLWSQFEERHSATYSEDASETAVERMAEYLRELAGHK